MDSSITLLKEIIKDDTILVNSINNIEPVTFKSIKLFYSTISPDEDEIDKFYSHFAGHLKELNPYKEDIEFVSSEGDIRTLKVLEHDYDILNTTIAVSSVKGLKNNYEITTYSPFYSYFIINHHQWIIKGNYGNTSILKDYNKIFNMIDKWENDSNVSDKNDYTSLDSLDNKFLFYYLVEKQLAFRYKYYVYEYVKKFLDEFDSNFPHYKKDHIIAVKDYYIMHLIDIFAKFNSISVFTTKSFCDCIYEIFVELALKCEAADDKATSKVTEFENELFSVLKEISNFSKNLEINENIPTIEGIRRVMDEIDETNYDKADLKLIPYWYNIQYLINFNRSEINNFQDFVRNGFSYEAYRKNFPFNEYYTFMTMLNRPKF